MSIGFSRPRWVIASLCIASVAGCSGKATTYPAEGEVTFPDGKPLPGAVVSFRSIGGDRPVTSRGQTDSGGKFQLTTFTTNDGAIAGKHQALIAVPVVEAEGPRAKPRLDLRFADFRTSGLEFTVSEDPEQNNFKIVVTPPK